MAKKKDDRLEDLKNSFDKVWLAGLGALAQAEKQGGRFFKTLVKKGKKYEELIPVAGDAVKDSVKAARKQANDAFQGMEAAFDRQVKAAMKRAGVASKKDVDALKKEIATPQKERQEHAAHPRRKGPPRKRRRSPRKRKSLRPGSERSASATYPSVIWLRVR